MAGFSLSTLSLLCWITFFQGASSQTPAPENCGLDQQCRLGCLRQSVGRHGVCLGEDIYKSCVVGCIDNKFISDQDCSNVDGCNLGLNTCLDECSTNVTNDPKCGQCTLDESDPTACTSNCMANLEEECGKDGCPDGASCPSKCQLGACKCEKDCQAKPKCQRECCEEHRNCQEGCYQRGKSCLENCMVLDDCQRSCSSECLQDALGFHRGCLANCCPPPPTV